ncbi:hypothetical protein [Planomicrobium sp. CPCC 101079]|uniref:hypothetical protein n=1 Tax=Planomicrobium sp. CPCC 101079 TaxID=2599618 RepID=UPI0011B3F074|nr:hypothetical protein [Planomicrobium sp. CPCC 101079]TWT04794.1 hypothetical protein FQV28_09320 [Planomicrobium sp. CPCC 101079]
MHSRLVAIVASAILCGLFLLPQASLAAPNITVDASAGLQNKVKYEKGLPLQFTLTNNGSAFSGDLVLSYSESYSLGAGLAVPIELASGETKTIQVASTGLSDMSYMASISSQNIFLFEGGWKEGKSIKYNGSKTLKPNYFTPMDLFIASLTSNSDRLQQLKEVSAGSSGTPQLFHLNQMNQFKLPTEAVAWEIVDYLVIDEFAYSDLPDAVQQAVLQWVQQGGHVVVGSTGNLSAELGNLSEFLPLDIGGPLEAAVPGLEEQVPAFEATTKDGAKILLEDKGQVLAASRQIGSGTLTQTSFSLGDESVSSQKGYPKLMSGFLQNTSTLNANFQGETLSERMAYQVGEVNELFESFAVSKTLIMGIIILYILLIIPVLYVILKKKDKREYAWFIIPAAAILTSIGLFALGAKDRIGNAQIQQTGFFEVDANNGLNGYYINSLLSNRGGDYQFKAPASTTMSYRLKSQMTEEEPHQAAILERQVAGNSMTLRDMRYWSVSSIMGESYIENTGDFDVQLNVANRTIAGTITNNFPFAIEDVSIWTGTRLMSLGNLNPGQELQVEETINSDILAPASSVGQPYGYQPIADAKALAQARRQSLVTISYDELEDKGTAPYVIGYTKDAIVPISLEEQRASVSSLHLIAQSFKPETALSGNITLDAETFNMEVTSVNQQAYFENVSDDPYYYYFDDGDYEITYQVIEAIDTKQAKWEELGVSLATSGPAISIFNAKTNKYEEITGSRHTLDKQVEQYISPEGTIKFSLEMRAGASSAPEVALPKLKLKGEVAP